jgi:hypothetical protein
MRHISRQQQQNLQKHQLQQQQPIQQQQIAQHQQKLYGGKRHTVPFVSIIISALTHPQFWYDGGKLQSLFPARGNSTNNRNRSSKIPTATHLVTATATQLVTATTSTAMINSNSNTVAHSNKTRNNSNKTCNTLCDSSKEQQNLRQQQHKFPGNPTAATQLNTPHHDMPQQ